MLHFTPEFTTAFRHVGDEDRVLRRGFQNARCDTEGEASWITAIYPLQGNSVKLVKLKHYGGVWHPFATFPVAPGCGFHADSLVYALLTEAERQSRRLQSARYGLQVLVAFGAIHLDE